VKSRDNVSKREHSYEWNCNFGQPLNPKLSTQESHSIVNCKEIMTALDAVNNLAARPPRTYLI